LPAGVPFGLTYVNPEAKDTGLVHFERHFNNQLAEDSYYFRSLKEFMTCVEKNVGTSEPDRVCAKEFKKLRMQAFDNQLFYHNINKRMFTSELAYLKHENPL
jgi:hypothetical protein